MTTLGLKLKRNDEPGLVCHHSGMSKEDCPCRTGGLCLYQYVNTRPTPCNVAWVGCPPPEQIYTVLTPKIRESWPQWHLDQEELRQWDMEIPAAIRVWVYAKS